MCRRDLSVTLHKPINSYPKWKQKPQVNSLSVRDCGDRLPLNLHPVWIKEHYSAIVRPIALEAQVSDVLVGVSSLNDDPVAQVNKLVAQDFKLASVFAASLNKDVAGKGRLDM